MIKILLIIKGLKMNLLHPPFVHFVVALPIVALFSQFTYMVTKDKSYSKAALRIIAFSFLTSIFAVLGGINDAQIVIENNNILQEGLAFLDSHKIAGFIVVFALLITTLTKWFAISKNSSLLETVSLILIIITLAGALYQGRSGGELVYKYSAGIENKIITQRAKELNIK